MDSNFTEADWKLFREGAITEEDLDGFSEDYKGLMMRIAHWE